MTPPDTFLAEVEALGVSLTPAQLADLGRFVELLLEANLHTNLTAIRDAESAWTRHVLDSLSLVAPLTREQAKRVIDVGAGGGLPGLVLAIAQPDVEFTLVDATGKKVRHIAQTAEALGLKNVRAIQARAEDLTGRHAELHTEHRQHYDVALARALAPMPVLAELLAPLVKVGGSVLAIKGERAEEEIQAATSALKRLGLSLEDTHRTTTGTVLLLRKVAKTPAAYPRRPGEPKRAPIR